MMQRTYLQDHPSLPPLASGAMDFAAPSIAAGTPLDDDHVDQADRQYKIRKAHASSVDVASLEEVKAAKKRKVALELENYGCAVPAWAARMQDTLGTINNRLTEMNNRLATIENAANDPQTGLVALGEKISDPQTGLAALGEKISHPQTGLAALGEKISHPQTGLAALGEKISHPQTGLAALGEKINTIETGLTDLRSTLAVEMARNQNRVVRTLVEPIVPAPNIHGDSAPESMWFPRNLDALVNAKRRDLDSLAGFYGLDRTGGVQEMKTRLKRHLGISI